MSEKAITVKREEVGTFKPVHVPINTYDAKIKEVRTIPGFEGKGETLVTSFEILQGDQNGQVVDGLASLKLNEKSKLYKWLSRIDATLIPDIGETLDVSKMVGKECRILTDDSERTDKDGKKFLQSKVTEVLSKGEDSPTSNSEVNTDHA